MNKTSSPICLVALLSLGCNLATANLHAQQPPPKVQVMSLEKVEINDGLITDEIAKRFNTKVQSPVVSKQITHKTEVGMAYADEAHVVGPPRTSP